jgi:hypothetical protein
MVLVLISSCIDDESQPIGDLPFNPTTGIDSTSLLEPAAGDSTSANCIERTIWLSNLSRCPAYGQGFLNDQDFSSLVDVTEHPSISRTATGLNFRSFVDSLVYSFELTLTFSEEPQDGACLPLKTNGNSYFSWSEVESDSVYAFALLWFDFPDLSTPVAYKIVRNNPNLIRVDSTRRGVYDNAPVVDRYGELDATMVLNTRDDNLDVVDQFRSMNFCVPDTLRFQNVRFDARTRDVFSPCRRVPGR